MAEREYAPQVVTVESAERWMDRPVKVNLTMHVTARTANTQSFYLDEDEARALIAALQSHLDVREGLRQSAAGDVHDLGDFTRYAEEDV